MHRKKWTCISLRICLLISTFFCAHITKIYCQSHFYNSQQYGLRSTLLGGAVTAGDADLSMAYYNPGALHLAESRVAISLIKPEISNFGVGDYFGSESNSTSINIQLSPSLVSYNFIRTPKVHVSFITLQKSDWDFDISTKSNLEARSLNIEQIFDYRYRGSDSWYGFSSSYKINNSLAIGISQFISSSSFEYENINSTNKFVNNQDLQAEFFSRRLKTRQSISFSLISKIGLHYKLDKLSLGLVLKTPNYLSTFRSGSFTLEEIRKNPSITSVDNSTEFELVPQTKTPWEFNLGASLLIDSKSKLWANVSYYSGISDHSLSRITTIDENIIDWRHKQNKIVNFAIGVSNQVNEKTQVIASFRTNFMAYTNQEKSENIERQYLLDGDRFHFALGTNLFINRSAITIGLDFAFSNKNNEGLFSEYPNIEQSRTFSSKFKNESLTLLFTYEFLLERLKTQGKKIEDMHMH